MAVRQRISCPHCGKETPKAEYCMFCGKQVMEHGRLYRSQDQTRSEQQEELAVRQELAGRYGAEQADQELRQTILATAVCHPVSPDGRCPSLTGLNIAEGRRGVISLGGHSGRTLEPGRYDLSKEGQGKSGLASFMTNFANAGAEGLDFLTVWEYSTTTIPVRCVLPDWETLKAQSGGGNRLHEVAVVQAALETLGIRTSDNLLGGASITLDVRIKDGAEFQKTAIISALENETGGVKSDEIARRFANDRPKLMRRIWDAARSKTNSPTVKLPPYTARKLVRRIRDELAQTVRVAVRNETAERLYDTLEVKDSIHATIADGMRETLDRLGIELVQISAFQFHCPDYDKLMAVRQKNKLALDSLRDEKDAAEIERERMNLLGEQARFGAEREQENIRLEGGVSRVEIEQDAMNDALKDKHKLSAIQRTNDQDRVKRLHDREQQEQDRLQELKLQRAEQEQSVEHMSKMLELQLRKREADHRLRLEEVKVWSDLEPEKILFLAMRDNPQLAAAYQAAEAAKGRAEVQRMQEAFRDQLVEVLGSDRERVNTLMGVAVQQLGNVLGKREAAKRAQVITDGRVVRMVDDEPQDQQDEGKDED